MNTQTDPAWTRPYFGVTHRYVNGRQCSVTVRSADLATAVVFGRRGTGTVFTDTTEGSFNSADEAKAWCEQNAPSR